MRNIFLFFTQESREVSIASEATTLGQLKAELAAENLNGKKLTVKETRSTLESSESPLPAGEFTLYVYPAKSKAGFNREDEDNLLNDILDIKDNIALILEKLNGAPTPSYNPTPAVPLDPRIAQMKADAEALQREMNGGDDDVDNTNDNY